MQRYTLGHEHTKVYIHQDMERNREQHKERERQREEQVESDNDNECAREIGLRSMSEETPMRELLTAACVHPISH